MQIELLEGNALDGNAEGILLTVDGSKWGLEGNIARAFAKRNPDLWEEMEQDIVFPIALGRAVAYPVDPVYACRNRVVLLASTLHHTEVLMTDEKARVVRTALYNALSLCAAYRLRSMATAVLTGGWRLESEQALEAMIDACRSFNASNQSAPALRIFLLPREALDLMAAHLRIKRNDVVTTKSGYRIELRPT